MNDCTQPSVEFQSPEQWRMKFVLVALPSFYLAIVVATVIDGVLGRSLMALWSLLLVTTCAFLLIRLIGFLKVIDSLENWLWHGARCVALGSGLGLLIGLSIMLFGDGASSTLSRGLALASFSMLYGVLIALPAGCAVILLDQGDD